MTSDRTELITVRITPEAKIVLQAIASMYGEKPAVLAAQLIQEGLATRLDPAAVEDHFNQRKEAMLAAARNLKNRTGEVPPSSE